MLLANPFLDAIPGFAPIGNFKPVSTVAKISEVLIVHPSLGAKSLADFVRMANSKSGQISYCSGSNGHIRNIFAWRVSSVSEYLSRVRSNSADRYGESRAGEEPETEARLNASVTFARQPESGSSHTRRCGKPTVGDATLRQPRPCNGNAGQNYICRPALSMVLVIGTARYCSGVITEPSI